MKKKMSLREFCRKYRNGDFDKPDFNTMVAAGWYNWFCDDDELLPRLKEIWKILNGITNDFVLDNYYVWFDNNCPAMYPLYDDVRFEPLNDNERGNAFFMIMIDNKRYNGKYTIVTSRSGYKIEAEYDEIEKVHDFINCW